MRKFALPHYFTLLWARLFALGSLFFLSAAALLVISGLPVTSTAVYTLLLMGFVNFYLISVQHGAIPFPRNRGGIYSRGATFSFILMFFGLVVLAIFHFRPAWSGWGWIMYRAGFLLYILLQHRLVLLYRWRSRKWQFDTLFGLFYGAGMFWGLLSILPMSYFGSLHLLFLGFQLNSFLACAYFMLPRFSRMVREKLRGGLWMGITAFLLVNLVVLFNLLGFLIRAHFPMLGRWIADVQALSMSVYLLQIAAIFLMSGLLLYILGVGKFVIKALKVASFAHVFSVMYFLLGAYYSMFVAMGNYGFKGLHQHLMISGMMLFAMSMGYYWYMLNFSLSGSSDWKVFALAITFLLLVPVSDLALIPFAILLIVWFFLEISRNRIMLLNDTISVLKEIGRIF